MAKKNSDDKKSSGKNAVKKAARRELNEKQHADNLATMRELGIQARVGSVTKLRTGRKGETTAYTKSYEVRPSKLIRVHRRAEARLLAGK
jgi:hypothetical protein